MKAGTTGTLWAEARELSRNFKLGSYAVEVKDDAGELVGIELYDSSNNKVTGNKTKELSGKAEKNLGNVEFVTGQAVNAEEAARLLEQAGPDAPVLAISASIFGLSAFDPLHAVFVSTRLGGHNV